MKTFIEKLDNCVAVREMMWYSINDLPNSVKIKILERKVDQNIATIDEKGLLLNVNKEFYKYLRYLRSEL